MEVKTSLTTISDECDAHIISFVAVARKRFIVKVHLMANLAVLILILYSMRSFASLDLKANEKCGPTFLSAEGTCVEPKHCQYFKEYRNRLKICSFDGLIPIVCCPEAVVARGGTAKRKSEAGNHFINLMTVFQLQTCFSLCNIEPREDTTLSEFFCWWRRN